MIVECDLRDYRERRVIEGIIFGMIAERYSFTAMDVWEELKKYGVVIGNAVNVSVALASVRRMRQIRTTGGTAMRMNWMGFSVGQKVWRTAPEGGFRSLATDDGWREWRAERLREWQESERESSSPAEGGR